MKRKVQAHSPSTSGQSGILVLNRYSITNWKCVFRFFVIYPKHIVFLDFLGFCNLMSPGTSSLSNRCFSYPWCLYFFFWACSDAKFAFPTMGLFSKFLICLHPSFRSILQAFQGEGTLPWGRRRGKCKVFVSKHYCMKGCMNQLTPLKIKNNKTK